MLAEMGHHIGAKEYPEFTGIRSRIYLIDAGPVLLGPMSKVAQAEATKVLGKLGVQIITGVAVKDYADGKVILDNGTAIPTKSLIWTSGVIAREVSGLPEGSTGRGRRILVDAFNKVKGTVNIFAIGDICYQDTDPQYPNGHPQLAQVAIQQGKLLAHNLQQFIAKQPIRPFIYVNKGSMAIISKYKAVADLPKFSFKGLLAWFVWLFIHIIPLVGFRNKAKLAFSWFYSFITNNPTLRLIIRPKERIS